MIVGITGGIGSGKSAIAYELVRRGYTVYDCDREAKRIIAENKDVQAAIMDLLGKEAFTLDSRLSALRYNTSYVAQRVFAEPKLLQALNAIVHPEVVKDIQVKQENRTKYGYFFIESAILFEAGLDQLCVRVFIIDAPEEVRIRRVLCRDYNGEATEENINKVRARIRNQEPIALSQAGNKKATVIINDGNESLSYLADQLVGWGIPQY